MMAFITVNKRNIISPQLAFKLLCLISTLLLVAHARDISRSKRSNVDIKDAAASSVLQYAELVKSSDISSRRSSYAFEAKQKQDNLSGAAAAAEGTDDDLLFMDYAPVRHKSPIHN